jgi:hypothetical protein
MEKKIEAINVNEDAIIVVSFVKNYVGMSINLAVTLDMNSGLRIDKVIAGNPEMAAKFENFTTVLSEVLKGFEAKVRGDFTEVGRK